MSNVTYSFLRPVQVDEFLSKCERWLEWLNKQSNNQYEWNRDDAERILLSTISSDGMCYVAMIKDEIVGCAMFTITKMFMTPEKCAMEQIWNTDPDLPTKTKVSILKKFLELTDRWADHEQVKQIIIPALSKLPSIKLLLKNGFKQSETYYIKERK